MSDNVEPEMNGAALTGEEILASGRQLKMETVQTPEWGKDNSYVYILSLTGAHAGAVQHVAAEHEAGNVDEGRVWAHWCILACCDAAGNRIFTEENVDGLVATSLGALQRCTAAIMKLNGITGGVATEKKTP